jgi:hypothetical protein
MSELRGRTLRTFLLMGDAEKSRPAVRSITVPFNEFAEKSREFLQAKI